MAETNKAKNPEPKNKAAPEAKPVPAEPKAAKFSVARLRQDCAKLFGVMTSTFDGATCGLSGEYTVKEMQERIQKWLNKPVLTGRRKERK